MSLLPLSLVLSCPKHLAYLSPFSPAATFLLPTQSSVHNLFERARLRGSEKNKGIINGEEVRKKNFGMPRYPTIKRKLLSATNQTPTSLLTPWILPN
jgi:hypothetical protein